MRWTDRTLLAIDTETTGVDCWTDRVVELAAVEIDAAGQPLAGPTHLIVNPGVEIPEGAASVHGITTDRARSEGVATAEAIGAIAERIWEAGPGTPIVMFNARFDWPLLIAEAERHGVEFPAFAPILDPYLIDRMCDRYRKGRRQLTLVAEHYGVELGDAAHGALADATAAGQVMRKLIARFPELASLSLASVYVRQVHGQFEDGERFADYMRRNNDPSFVHTPGWPIPVGPLTTFGSGVA